MYIIILSNKEPSGSPGSVSFGTVTLTSITVQWGEVQCSRRNGEITGYTVEYSSTTPPTTNTMSGSSSRELVVGDLLPRTSYTFTVRAEGASPSSSATTFTSTPTGYLLCSSSVHMYACMSNCNSLCVQNLVSFLMGYSSLTTV